MALRNCKPSCGLLTGLGPDHAVEGPETIEVELHRLEGWFWDCGEHPPGGIGFGVVGDVNADHAAGAAAFRFSTDLPPLRHYAEIA